MYHVHIFFILIVVINNKYYNYSYCYLEDT